MDDYPHDPHRRHQHHQHHHRREGDDDQYPPPPGRQPPPPYYGGNDPPPPFYPPPPSYGRNEQPPPHYPPQPEVYHTSHHGPGPGPEAYPAPPPPNFSDYPPPADDQPHHHFPRPHLPHHTPHGGGGGGRPDFADRPTVKVYCKAETNYSLSIRDGKLILARADPSDPHQHWIKDEKFSTRIKDEEGLPSFALVNKATGQAMKHATGPSHPVQLIPYNPDVVDESVLWTESKDTGDNYRAIRMVNNIKLNVDAWNADKDHGGVRDGTTISLWDWTKGDNQRWKIVPY